MVSPWFTPPQASASPMRSPAPVAPRRCGPVIAPCSTSNPWRRVPAPSAFLTRPSTSSPPGPIIRIAFTTSPPATISAPTHRVFSAPPMAMTFAPASARPTAWPSSMPSRRALPFCINLPARWRPMAPPSRSTPLRLAHRRTVFNGCSITPTSRPALVSPGLTPISSRLPASLPAAPATTASSSPIPSASSPAAWPP